MSEQSRDLASVLVALAAGFLAMAGVVGREWDIAFFWGGVAVLPFAWRQE